MQIYWARLKNNLNKDGFCSIAKHFIGKSARCNLSVLILPVDLTWYFTRSQQPLRFYEIELQTLRKLHAVQSSHRKSVEQMKNETHSNRFYHMQTAFEQLKRCRMKRILCKGIRICSVLWNKWREKKNTRFNIFASIFVLCVSDDFAAFRSHHTLPFVYFNANTHTYSAITTWVVAVLVVVVVVAFFISFRIFYTIAYSLGMVRGIACFSLTRQMFVI